MHKLRLDLDALKVESFNPGADAAVPGGTVRGAEAGDTNDSATVPSFGIEASCVWTHCFNFSCMNACGTGGGGNGTYGMADTCAVHLCPPEVE